MIYVTGGTVHTLGPGSIIAETQQQSDTTYRLYDYGRARPLHLERGLASIKEHTGSGKVIRPAPVGIHGGKSRESSMIAAPYFTVDLFELKEAHEFSTSSCSTRNGGRDLAGKTSVQILVALEGCGVVEAQGCDPVTFAKGDAVVIPANLGRFSVRPQWAVEFLKAEVPDGSLAEPATRL
jgi:mannose-6-phosphate isomerase